MVITKQGKYSSKYALTDMLHCGVCGSKYRRVTWSKNGKSKVVWRCINRLEHGRKYCTDSPTIEESVLHNAIVRALNSFVTEYEDVVEVMKSSIAEATGVIKQNNSKAIIQAQIDALNKEMLELVETNLKNGLTLDETEGKFKELSQQIDLLTRQLEHMESTTPTSNDQGAVVEKLIKEINRYKDEDAEYDDNIVRQTIECIRALPDGKLTVIFGGGYAVEVGMDGIK